MKSLFLISLLILLFGLVSERLHRTIFTPPMVFVAIGLAVGAGVFGSFENYDGAELTHLLTEITLVVVLFTDASRISLTELEKDFKLPLRLLGVAMPLTILLGTVVAYLLFDDLTFWGAAVVATVLAPTDAALGQAVVLSTIVPARIRQALNVESGLNDGLAVPLVLITIALASVMGGAGTTGYWASFTLKQILLGPLVGIGVGYIGGKLVERGARAHWMTHSFQQLSALALALIAFLGAEQIGGDGFIAAFTAGLTLANAAKGVCGVLQEFAETEGQLLALLTFLCFGAHLIWPVIGEIDGTMILYAVLSLTVIRMVPVALSLLGSGLMPVTYGFLGWFGPRGLATILFASLVLEHEVPGGEQIYLVALTTAFLSVFLHGLTAWPGAKLYSRSCRIDDEEREMAEHMPAAETPVRIRFRESAEPLG